jgi:MoaA/NifB/PqqE/SkfB family radical SAM enzyme
MGRIDPNLARVFFPWALRRPRYLRSFLRVARSHRSTRKTRLGSRENGLIVPPFLILSITSRCNLKCAGCYASTAGTVSDHAVEDQLSLDAWRRIISEASELGVVSFVIAGGEPFLFEGLLDLPRAFKDRFFIIVTNGTAIRDEHYRQLKGLGNVCVLASVDGDPMTTDARRGQGVHELVTDAVERLCRTGVLAGISATITRQNFRYWMDEDHLAPYLDLGVKVAIFLEYIPTTPFPTEFDGCTDHGLILREEERKEFRSSVLRYREGKPLYIIHSPGDEEFFGGCVSAGRGFAHVTPNGDLTPCPVSNVATHNLVTTSLKEALASPLFSVIRENEHLLETEGMPCALFAHPEEVEEIAKTVGAYKTSGNSRNL